MSARQRTSRSPGRVLKVDPRKPDPGAIGRAAELIRAGGVVCYPTRCLYGLGADARNAAAVEKVFALKQRPATMALLVLIHRPEEMAGLAARIPRLARALMDRFWPGRLTIVLEAAEGLPAPLTAGTGKIGIRLAGHPVASALVSAFGGPITGTSANLSGSPGCVEIPGLDPGIRNGVDLVLDAGRLKGGVGSTVVDVTGEKPVVIREGEVPKAEILAVAKEIG